MVGSHILLKHMQESTEKTKLHSCTVIMKQDTLIEWSVFCTTIIKFTYCLYDNLPSKIHYVVDVELTPNCLQFSGDKAIDVREAFTARVFVWTSY